MQPTLGRIVHVIVDPSINNGSNVAPAVITRVWSPSGPGRWTVNYKILLDQASHETLHRTSAYLYADEDAARAALAELPTPPTGWSSGAHAFWPPRA